MNALVNSILRMALNAVAAVACLVVGMSVNINLFVLDRILQVVDLLGGKPEMLEAHKQRVNVEPEYESPDKFKKLYVDADRTLAKSVFPLAPETLIAKSKEIIQSNFGVKNPELFSDDFQFIFPIVGPLSKTEFIAAFASFKLEDAAPDAAENFFGFNVDPMEPNRVWYMTRATLTHTGPLKFFTKTVAATGIKVVQTPQLQSFSFDEEGRCYKFTGGYPVDRTTGNAGGLGGLFGVMYAVGQKLPFPEGQPWRPSPQWMMGAYRLSTITREWMSITGQKGSPYN